MDRDEDFEEDGFAVVAPPAALKKAKSKNAASSSSVSTARPKAKKPQPVKKNAPSKKAVASASASASSASASSASASSAGKKPVKSSADDVDMVAASDSGSSSDDAPLSKLKSNSIAKAKKAKEKTAAKPTKPKPKAMKPKATKAVEAAADASAPTAAAVAKKKSKPKPKPKAKVEARAVTASRSPSPARRPSSGMLSVFELCNTDDDGNRNDGRADRDVEDDAEDDDDEDNASTIGSEAGHRGVPIDVDADDEEEEEDGDEEETTSTVDGDDASDQDEGWSDHNRWYCNICKDGGELLCCDRCPRAFHMSCLGMGETAIPDTEWFCKMCSECLDRRRAKSEKKEKARLLREAEKLERDAKKLQLKQQKEEMIAKKSVDAIENKAKRVLEMQDRILSRKKIKYKDKEEEKLGKLAEDLAQTVRDAKEKLEKLEKEDVSLKKKEEALNKKKKGIDDLPDDIDSRGDKPTPQECNFGALPSKYMGAVLAVWDSISSFSKILNLSPISVEQFGSALAHQEHSALMTEIHMCLLDLIMEDREDEDYMSDDESATDERERYRYEVQHAPLTVGVPTLTMLNSLSWPSVLHSLIVAVPRYTAHATTDFREAINALYNTEYPKLSVRHKLSLLSFLVRRAFGTEKIRQMLGKHLGETIQASKEFNRAVLQDRKVALEDEKKLREKQKAELAGLVEKSKTSVKTWLKSDNKKSASNGNADTADENEDDAQSDSGAPGSASDSDLDDLAYNEEALVKNEEELERLQVEDRISRHEYLSRKKSLEVQRERLRKKAEEKLRKQRMQEQMERKRTAAKKGIQEGLLSKDASLLRAAIEKGKECSLLERIIVSATHVLEILEAEAVREDEADTRKRKFNEMIRSSFVRTEPLGRDRNQCRYWILQGDKQRLYIEKPGSSEKLKLKYESMENGGPVKSDVEMEGEDGAIWYCYSSEAEVIALVDSLDTRITREAQLKTALTENFDLITSDMPMSKPGLLISDLLNEDSSNGKKRQRKGNGAANSVPTDFSVWRNERKTWRKKPHAVVGVDAFRDDLIEVEAWLSKRLRDYGSNWQERTPGGHVDWLKNVKSVTKVAEFVNPLLALETEVMSFQLKAQGLPAAQTNGAQEASKSGESSRTGDNDKSDDEDDDEDELDALADDGSILWPTTHCRNRWIEEVKKAKTIATLSVALASFEQRLDVFGLAEVPNEDQGVSTRRAKSEKEKRSRKERAAKKNQSKEESEEIPNMRDSNDEWEEDCYICSEGGELLCCDGCPRVFHYTCAGLRRIPRGKTFCHVCDASVKPIFPVAKTTRSSAEARKEKDSQVGTSDARTTSSNGANASKEAGDHIHPASGGKPQMTTRSSEDQWDVDCSVCALGGELLCCDGCPRAFHVACIGMEEIPDDEWFCNECNLQTCGACKKNKIRLDSHVICGSEDGTKGCERVFHLKCAKLSAVPEDDWFCKKCRSSLQK